MSATARDTEATRAGKPDAADPARPAPASAPLAVAARLYGFLRPWLWPRFAAAFACMVAYSAMSGLVPWLVRTLIDDVFRARDERMLHMLPPAIALVFLVRAAVNFGQAWLGDSVGEGIAYVSQHKDSIAALRRAVGAFDAYALAGLGIAVPAMGSLVLGLALAEGALDADSAFRLGALDELFESEQWGEDEEAVERRKAVAADIAVAERFIRLSRT